LGWSHMQYQGRIADVLTDAGHEVHVLIFEQSPLLGNYNGTNRSQKVIRIPRREEKKNEMLKMSFMADQFAGSNNMLLSGMMADFNRFSADYCDELLTDHQELLESLEKEQYDVGISEFFDLCMFGVFHKIGVKTKLASYAITMNSWAAYHFGISQISSYVT
ncbi:unnamed protein product, partial [Sphagnum compactum]